jgi:hypothetical protein
VWPEPVTSEHAGRLELWVGRADISKAKPPPWPLLRTGQADVFGELPFGTDVRGRGVKVPMAYHNWLIGSIPRQGKTASVRVLTCGAALDPLAELWLHELKGSSDLDPLESCSHRFVSGIHDEAIAHAAESLKLLRAARRWEGSLGLAHVRNRRAVCRGGGADLDWPGLGGQVGPRAVRLGRRSGCAAVDGRSWRIEVS